MSEYDCSACGVPTHCSELDSNLVCDSCNEPDISSLEGRLG